MGVHLVFGSVACKCASIKGVWCVWMWGLDAAQATQGLHGLWVSTRVGPVKGVDCMCGCWDEERPAEGLTQAALLWNLMQCPRLKCSVSRLCVVLLRLGRTVHWRDGTRLECEAVNTTPGAEFCLPGCMAAVITFHWCGLTAGFGQSDQTMVYVFITVLTGVLYMHMSCGLPRLLYYILLL